MTFIRNMIILLLLGVTSMVLPGCNTLEGAGEDVEKVGEKVQDVADDD